MEYEKSTPIIEAIEIDKVVNRDITINRISSFENEINNGTPVRHGSSEGREESTDSTRIAAVQYDMAAEEEMIETFRRFKDRVPCSLEKEVSGLEFVAQAQDTNGSAGGPPGFYPELEMIPVQFNKTQAKNMGRKQTRKSGKGDTLSNGPEQLIGAHPNDGENAVEFQENKSYDDESENDVKEARKTWEVGKGLELVASDENVVLESLSQLRRRKMMEKKSESQTF